MNKRSKKKTEKQKRELIHKLLDMALDINGLEPRKQSITGSLPTAFFWFSGHVGWTEVSICSTGWDPGKCSDTQVCPSTYILSELADAVHKLETLKKAETPAAGTTGESR